MCKPFIHPLSAIAAASVVTYFSALPMAAAERSLTANAAITSNYVFRGQTQSDNGIAAQGGIDFTDESEFYAGAWASSVSGTSGNSGGGFEIDAYGGWAHSWDDFGLDVGYIIYDYTDSKFAAGARELYVGFDWGPASITYYNGDDQNTNPNDYNYIDVGLEIELVDDVLLSFHYGRFSPDRGSSFNDIKVEASKKILDFDVSLSVTYEDGTSTNAYNATTSKDTELFVTVKKAFDL